MIGLLSSFSWGSLLFGLSVTLNVVQAVALLFKSALNQIAVDLYTRVQKRRERRRSLLLELYEHMGLFDARYMVVTATFLLDAAVADMDPESGAAAEVRSAKQLLAERFSEPFSVSQDFVNRHELELPARIRDSIIRMREAMQFANAAAATDPVDIDRRTTAVRGFVEEIRTEIRRLIH
jgi:hypothetical protein